MKSSSTARARPDQVAESEKKNEGQKGVTTECKRKKIGLWLDNKSQIGRNTIKCEARNVKYVSIYRHQLIYTQAYSNITIAQG